MKLTFNAIDIFDMVVDEVLAPAQLQEIADQLYKDRRGGELVDLWANSEFCLSLSVQLGHDLGQR